MRCARVERNCSFGPLKAVVYKFEIIFFTKADFLIYKYRNLLGPVTLSIAGFSVPQFEASMVLVLYGNYEHGAHV